jgi:hypothetical protein
MDAAVIIVDSCKRCLHVRRKTNITATVTKYDGFHARNAVDSVEET